MRLTLRTLLAYMDGMLDPEDEKVLDAKIQESEFATDLVQRIRSAMKQLRLGAPRSDAKGANDANLVADYLDGTLPEEQISNFERMCLDSDLNLSEVASCHQILMRVLGEPAHVRAELRERIYRTPEVAAKTPPVEAPPVQSVREDEVLTKEDVEELVAPTASRSYAPAIVILAAAICLMALVIWWPFGSPSPLVGLMGGGEEEPSPNPVEVGSPDEGGTGDSGTGDSGTGDSGTGDSGTGDSGTGGDDDGTPGEVPDTGTGTAPGDATAGDTNPGESGNVGSLPPGGTGAAVGDNAAADGETGDNSGTPPMAGDPPTVGDSPKPGDSAATPGGTGDSPPMPPGGGQPMPTPDIGSTTETPAAPTTVESAAEMGRFNNAQQLLLRREADAWMRVPAAGLLRERDQIVSPPYYRPSVAMVNGVQLFFAGASNATLIRRNENDTPTIGLDRGRIVIATSGKAGAAIVLVVKGRQARLTFGDAESQAAIEVRHFIQPGADIANPIRQEVVEVFPLGGSITWTDAEGEFILRPNQVLAMTDTQPAAVFALPAAPEWTNLRVSSSVAARAAESLEPAVLDGRPASLSLQEKVGFRQQETVALAIDTLCQVGEVEQAIRAFSNDKQHAYWPNHLNALRAQIARSPEHAKEVRDALAALHPEQADKMYGLVIGYSNTQLAAGKANELVADLENEFMPLRVLAYENLKRVTGRQNFYQAQKVAERQRDKIRFWKELADESQITYPVPPTPLPNREPLSE